MSPEQGFGKNIVEIRYGMPAIFFTGLGREYVINLTVSGNRHITHRFYDGQYKKISPQEGIVEFSDDKNPNTIYKVTFTLIG